MTVVLPPHRVLRLRARGGECGGPQGGAGPPGAEPLRPGGLLRAEPGREADKAPPAPSPRPRSRREGEGGLEEGGRRKRRGGGKEKEEGEGAAVGGTGQDRAEQGERAEEGAGRPRRTRRREGFLASKINKLFLFTCGVGGGGEERSGLLSFPAGSLSRNARRKPAPASAPTSRLRPQTGDAIDTPHTDRAPAPPIEVRSAGKRAKARGAAALLGSPPPAPPCTHARNPTRGGARGRGRRHLLNFRSQPSPRPNPERKAKEPESGDGRKDSTLS